MVDVFDDLYSSKIIEKDRLLKVFKIDDARWKSDTSVEVKLITDFVRDKLIVVHADCQESIWVCKVHWICNSLGVELKYARNMRMDQK